MPLFSIIVPVYNTSAYLVECLDSILGQSFHDFEVICIDDGSTDGSLQILKQYAGTDNRIKLVSVPNGGVSAARNLGMSLAQGDYLMFVDSDDWLVEGALERLERVVSREKYDIVSFNFTHFFEESGSFVDNKTCPESEFDSGWSYFNSFASLPWFGTACGRLFSRKLIDEHCLKFSEKISHFEDLMFTIDACRVAGSVKVIPDALYIYRRGRQGSLMQSGGLKRLIDMVRFANEMAEKLEGGGCADKTVLYRIIAAYYRNCLTWCQPSDRREIRGMIVWDYYRMAASAAFKEHAVYLALRYVPDMILPLLSRRSKTKATI